MFNHKFFLFAIIFAIVASAITALVFFCIYIAQKRKRMVIEEARKRSIKRAIDARNLELWYRTDGRAHEWEYEKYPR